jgi:magnesium transporter
VRSWIDHSGEVVWEPSPSLIAQLIEAGQPFWLDIENPTDEIIDQLATRLGLHPLAVEILVAYLRHARRGARSGLC